MDLLFLILVAVGLSALSTIIKTAKKQGTPPAGRGRQAPAPSREEAPKMPERPIRPVEVDLPRAQPTLPSYIGGSLGGNYDDPFGESASVMVSTLQPIAAHEYSPTRSGARDTARQDEENPVIVPGLDLAFDGDTLVKGVIMSEILNRKHVRRPN